MKYGVLGDIHANLSALNAVFEELDRLGIDELISVGDVVGYGAAPNECIDMLRERDVRVVKGNHDAACVRELDDRYFNPYARAAIRWTQGVVTSERQAWLADLPLTLDLEHCQVAHGTLHNPEQFEYVLSPGDADSSLDIMTRPVCFVGHSHVPIAVLRLRDAPHHTAYTFDTEIDLSDATACVFNVGSVGQPRDENERTAFAVYDTDLAEAWIARLPYDIDREAERILEAGLPEVLAQRLRLGL